MTEEELRGHSRGELIKIAQGMGMVGVTRLRKDDLVAKIMGAGAEAKEAPKETPEEVAPPVEEATTESQDVALEAEAATEQEESEEPSKPKRRRRDRAGRPKKKEVAEQEESEDSEDSQGEETSKKSKGRSLKKRGSKASEEEQDDAGEGEEPKSRRTRRSRRRSRDAEVEESTEKLSDSQEDSEEAEEAPEPEVKDLIYACGVLEILPEGYGFLRSRNYVSSDYDIYVSQSLIRRNHLRHGDMVMGQVGGPQSNNKFFGLLNVATVNSVPAEQAKHRMHYEQLTPVFPDEKITLEGKSNDFSRRIIDLFCPIGKGQRGMLVAPPKAGKTILLKKIAQGIAENHPEIVLMALLIDERPEEVTDMERSIKGEVIASTFDEPPEQHAKVCELALAKAMRKVEMGQDVVILVDSLTRMGRAYNNITPPSGRTLSGGLDTAALRMPKRFFGAARNIENGGSLTIIATALVETGSKMDEVIFEEFKGTGNMELDLSRRLAEKRVFPAIDLRRSSTRKEELLLQDKELSKIILMRRALMLLSEGQEPTEAILERLRKTDNNQQFLSTLGKENTPARA